MDTVDELFEQLSDSEKPWNRQSMRDAAGIVRWESAKANSAFREYCQLREARSVRQVAKALNKSHSLIGRWASRWKWQERVKHFDDMMRQAEVAGHMRARRAMATRQAKLALEAQGVVEVALQELKKRLAQTRHRHLTPGEIARLLETSTHIERICLGDPRAENDEVAAINVKICLQDRPRYLDAAEDAIDPDDLRNLDS